MEENIERYFGACAVLGELEAKRMWSKCTSTSLEPTESVRLSRLITGARNGLNKMESAFAVYLDDGEILRIKTRGESRILSAQEESEVKIEKEFRPLHVILDSKAFQNLTSVDVPFDVSLGFSWGPKFTFPFILGTYNIENYLAQLDCSVERTVPTALYDQVHHEISDHILSDNTIHEQHVRWLLFLKYRLDGFLKKHNDTIPVLADKGKIVVLMYLDEYRRKTVEHLSDERHYIKVEYDPLKRLVETEVELLKVIRNNETTKELLTPHQPNCLQLPKFYVTIKIHKGNTVRPITSNAGDTVGANLNRVFNKMIMSVFPPSDIHYKNAKDFKDEIVKLELELDDAMVSYDAVSMFTSIPTYLIIQIIHSRLDSFTRIFGVDTSTILKMANFLLNDCVFFTAFDATYKQTHGLPMGGAISPACCRLVMDFIIERVLLVIPRPLFMGVYVDDTLFVLKGQHVTLTLDALNSVDPNIQFTYELETAGTLNFLNLTLLRGLHDIKTNWFKKPLASNRLLNFYSSHKRSTVINTAKQFIRTVIELSDGNLFLDNKAKIVATLRENCFPETLIITLIHENYTLMRPMLNTVKDANREYVSFPHQINNRAIKDIVRNYKTSEAVLAESIRNNKINPIRIYKTKTPPGKRTNMILLATCICESKIKVQMTKFNQTCEMLEREMLDNIGVCHDERHSFRSAKQIRGLNSRHQTSKLVEFFQWKYRKELHGTSFQFPNKYLRKIMTQKFLEQ